MKTLMRYEIISGRVVEKRDVLIDVSLDPTTGKKRPRGKRRGASAADQIERNCNEAVLRLARILNATFGAGDLFLTLKYDDGRLPETREEAEHMARLLIQRVARAYVRATGKKLRWVLVTADRSSKTGAPVRLHHHLVIDATAWEVVARNWPADQMSARMLDGTGDYTAVARYMVRNAGYVRGKRTWSTSQGMGKVKFTAPKPVKGLGSFQVPKEAWVAERNVRENRESGFSAAYIRYVLPEEQGGTGVRECRSAEGAKFPDTRGGRARRGAGASSVCKLKRGTDAPEKGGSAV